MSLDPQRGIDPWLPMQPPGSTQANWPLTHTALCPPPPTPTGLLTLTACRAAPLDPKRCVDPGLPMQPPGSIQGCWPLTHTALWTPLPPPLQQGCWPLLPAGQPPWTPAGVLTINPFLPSLATAVLACWIETAAGQLQKTDCLNPRGYNLSCKHTFSNLGNKWKIG